MFVSFSRTQTHTCIHTSVRSKVPPHYWTAALSAPWCSPSSAAQRQHRALKKRSSVSDLTQLLLLQPNIDSDTLLKNKATSCSKCYVEYVQCYIRKENVIISNLNRLVQRGWYWGAEAPAINHRCPLGFINTIGKVSAARSKAVTYFSQFSPRL